MNSYVSISLEEFVLGIVLARPRNIQAKVKNGQSSNIYVHVYSPHIKVISASGFCSGALTLYTQNANERALKEIIWYVNKTTSFFLSIIRAKQLSLGRYLGKKQEHSLSHRILFKE